VMSTGELNADVLGRLTLIVSGISTICEKGVGVACRLLFSFIVIGRANGLFVTIAGATTLESIIGVPF
jgi:hypothetical protein